MFRPLSTLLAFPLLLGAPSVHAAPLVYEGFGGYAVEQLPGQTAGPDTVGLDRNAAIIGGGTASVNRFAADSLTFGNLKVTGGRAIYSSAVGAPSYIGYRYSGAAFSGTLYTSFLVRLETAPNGPSSVGLRVNQSNNSSGSSACFYSLAEIQSGTSTGVQYENTTGVTASAVSLPTQEIFLVIGRFTRTGQSLAPETPGTATLFVLTQGQFEFFRTGGFSDQELDLADIGGGNQQVFSRVQDSPVTSGTFNQLTTGCGIQFGVGNAGSNQVVSYDEIRMAASLDEVLPVISTPAVVNLETVRAMASEPVHGDQLPGLVRATRDGPATLPLAVPLVASGSAEPGVDCRALNEVVFPAGQSEVMIEIHPYTDAVAEPDESFTLGIQSGPGHITGPSAQATVIIRDRPPGTAPAISRFIQKAGEGTPQKIVVYGTSLTAAGAWSGQMLAALQGSYPGVFTMVNSGGSGMESNWGLANLQTRVISHLPDVVFIEFSVNDAVDRFNLSLATANSNLNAMIDAIQAARPSCEIILQVMNPVIDRPEGNPGWRPNLPLYQQGYRDIAAARRLLVIDHMPAWQAVLDEGEGVFRGFVPDGLHPEAAGYQRFVTPVILKALGAVTTDPPTLIVDNNQAALTGTWTSSAASPGFIGSDYLHDANASKGTKSATYTPQIPVAGDYPVYLRWTSDSNRASNVPVTIHHAQGSSTVSVNQRVNGGTWFFLGSHPFEAGSSGHIRIETTGTDGFVVADAVGIGMSGVMLRCDHARPAEPASGGQGARACRIMLDRSGPAGAALEVNLEITGTAANGTDYTSIPATASIAAGSNTAVIVLNPLEDLFSEGAETFRIRLLPGDGYSLLSPSAASITIEDRPLDAWRFANFTTAQLGDAQVSGDLADPDGDGLCNILECLTGSSPSAPDGADAFVSGMESAAGGIYQNITYHRMVAAGIDDRGEISTDLDNWVSDPGVVERRVLADDGITQTVRVRSLVPVGGRAREFLRVKATAP
jgi:acyl-CoA thioesterase I